MVISCILRGHMSTTIIVTNIIPAIHCLSYRSILQCRPRTKALKELAYKRLQSRGWPPEGASPLHPIEPWGKQFFVYNTVQDGTQETVLCVTNHSRKPLMHLYREDLEAVLCCMDTIKTELDNFQRHIEETESRYDLAKLELPQHTRVVQRLKSGRHSCHVVMRGRGRPLK